MGRPLRVIVISAAAIGTVLVAGSLARFSYAPMPEADDLLNPERSPIETAFDVLGRRIARDEAERLKATPEGRNALSPESGAVAIDDALVKRGREAFYRETFGNEVFLSDVMGMLDGGLTPFEVARAILMLGGAGTTNLKVRMARDVTVGDRVWKTGELVSTGLDVPRGSPFILGIRTFYDRGHLRMGITCALCHTAVDPQSGKVVEGAPNTDLNAGLLMALASNATAYFMHGSADPSAHPGDPARSVTTEDGAKTALPDPARFEAAAKVEVASWPAGSFDSSADRETNPTSIPSSFSAYGEPYSWSGRAGIGPFKGLSALNNNVHAANSDTTQQTKAAKTLFGLDPQVYLGTVLQGAAVAALRYDPASGKRPTDVLGAADPTPGAPGLNSYAVLPSFPATNYMTDNGLLASVSGEPANYANNAMSAFQNLLRAPEPSLDAERGEERAGGVRARRLRRLPFRAGAHQPSGHPRGGDRHAAEPCALDRPDGSAPRPADDLCHRHALPASARSQTRADPPGGRRAQAGAARLGPCRHRGRLQGAEPRRSGLERTLSPRFRRRGRCRRRRAARRSRHARCGHPARSGQQLAGAGRSQPPRKGRRGEQGLSEGAPPRASRARGTPTGPILRPEFQARSRRISSPIFCRSTG
ncbi:UNVERIFIED_ORG: hypothetical protein M2438_001365 [Methylobacterium sp. SuP10 SLI 274]|nr:hypothetical protein [Methylobacterium sp. SuP10 SLI 274]